jgi:hypothetical protein
VLQPSAISATARSADSTSRPAKHVSCAIPGLKQWLEQSPPVPPDFDPEQAKWDYLKEKHNL